MTAFVYCYNVNGYITFQVTTALTSKQSNVYEFHEESIMVEYLIWQNGVLKNDVSIFICTLPEKLVLLEKLQKYILQYNFLDCTTFKICG